jgi:AraC family transcriptional regulator
LRFALLRVRELTDRRPGAAIVGTKSGERRPRMFSNIGDISAIQADGAAPSVLVAGGAAGESGVQVVKLKYQGAAHFAATLHQHVITFMSQGPTHCRVAGKAFSHEAPEGSLAVLPAGVEATCDRSADTTSLLICVEPAWLALAAAEESAFAAKLLDRMTGYDANLLHLGLLLIEECAADYPRGALFWNEAASRFVNTLVGRHTSEPKPSDGVLDAAMLGRLRDYLMAHLDEPVDVATLAHMTRRSQFHFSRVFHRSVGVSPYRYIVYLRLRRADHRERCRRGWSRRSNPAR